MFRHRKAGIVRPSRSMYRSCQSPFELLESRCLLSVSAAEYAAIRNTYPDFALPASMSQINVIEIRPDQLGVASLQNAIAAAAGTILPDLVVLRTTATQHTITYSSYSPNPGITDELRILGSYGSLTIVGFGEDRLTLDADRTCPLIMVSTPPSQVTNLGGLVLTNGSGMYGGAIDHERGTLCIADCTISNSQASQGGGIASRLNYLTMTNVAICGNTADQGAGLYVTSKSVLTNVTISRNTATTSGGGIQTGTTTTLGVYNTIVAGNSAPTNPDIESSSPHFYGVNDLVGDGSGQSALANGINGSLVGTSAAPIDPMLFRGGRFTDLLPIIGSPAIDAGNSAWLPIGLTTDIYGAPRIQGSSVNIGAAETTWTVPPLSADEYTAIRGRYPEFDLPIDMSQLRIITIAADQYGMAGLQDAVQASIYFGPSLIVVRTTDENNTITYSSKDDELGISIGWTTIVGFGSAPLTLGAAGYCRGISFAPASSGFELNLGNITIAHGLTDSYGGGIEQLGGTLRLSDVTATGSTALAGGGIYSAGGVWPTSLVLTDCTVVDNTATSFGGGLALSTYSSKLTRVKITNNQSAGDGGGVYQAGTAADFQNVLIAGNTAGGNGGGAYLASGSSGFDSSVMVANSATSGGGVCVQGGTCSLRNATVTGNCAGFAGGGVFVAEPQSVWICNTIIAGNAFAIASDLYCDPSTTLGPNNLIGDGSGETAFVDGANGNIVGTTSNPADPMFVSTAGDWTQWDLRLQPSSPAINAGANPSYFPFDATDMAGAARIQGGIVDIGAYEFDSPLTVWTVTIGPGGPGRSMITSITVTFSEPVSLMPGALTITRRDGSAVPDLTVTPTRSWLDGRSWIITFGGPSIVSGSLPDGAYRLLVSASAVADSTSELLPADNRVKFFRLFGDDNGDRKVDRTELQTIRGLIGQSATNTPWFDYDGDGLITLADYRQLRLRLQRSLL